MFCDCKTAIAYNFTAQIAFMHSCTSSMHFHSKLKFIILIITWKLETMQSQSQHIIRSGQMFLTKSSYTRGTFIKYDHNPTGIFKFFFSDSPSHPSNNTVLSHCLSEARTSLSSKYFTTYLICHVGIFRKLVAKRRWYLLQRTRWGLTNKTCLVHFFFCEAMVKLKPLW